MNIMMQTMMAAVGTVAFAVLFSVQREHYLYCGIAGGSGWFTYQMMILLGATATEATFAGAVIVIVLSRFLAVWVGCPATVFVITGIFPLVPGAGIYWTAYYLVVGKLNEAANSGFMALKAAVAIVVGIVIIFELPNKMFQIGHKPH